jgi:hypothetical protein
MLAVEASTPLVALERNDEVSFDPVAPRLETIDETQAPLWQRSWDLTKSFVQRHKGKIAIGAAATSAALTIAFNPTGEVVDQITEALPWVGVGLVATEAAFVAGGSMMVTSVGGKIGNPLTVKQRIPEISQKASESTLFKAGFWVNTAGAVGSAAVITAGVITQLPPESYGLLSFAAADLAVTVGVRRTMLQGIKANSSSSNTPIATE